ncbi:hypothetical protein [Embleya sp. NPDC001921]
MIGFPGYVTVGHLDLSDDRCDREAYVFVYVDQVTGDAFTLQTFGCLCCGDALDGLLPGHGEQVTNLEDLATTLVGALNGAYLDGESRLLAEGEMRNLIQAMSGRFEPRALGAVAVAAIGS